MHIFTVHKIHVAIQCFIMMSMCAGEKIYTDKWLVAVALTLLRFNLLGWFVTPVFFFF